MKRNLVSNWLRNRRTLTVQIRKLPVEAGVMAYQIETKLTTRLWGLSYTREIDHDSIWASVNGVTIPEEIRATAKHITIHYPA